MPRHACYGVIQNHGNNLALVVDYLRRAGHSAVEEGRIPHYAEYLFILYAAALKGLRHAHGNRKASAHAHAAV